MLGHPGLNAYGRGMLGMFPVLLKQSLALPIRPWPVEVLGHTSQMGSVSVCEVSAAFVGP